MPTPSSSTRQEDVEDAADLSRPRHPRHHPQDRGRQRARSGVRAAAIAGAARARATNRASADPRSIPCTRRKSNASARARPIGPTSSASRSPSPPPSATPRGGQFVTHVKALPGNPYDGHTLATVILDIEALVGNTLERLLADKGYRGHNAPPDIQVQGLHLRPETGRNTPDQTPVAPQVHHRARDRPSQGRATAWAATISGTVEATPPTPSLAAAGYNFRRLIRWLSILWRLFITALLAAIQPVPALSAPFFTDDPIDPGKQVSPKQHSPAWVSGALGGRRKMSITLT